MVRMRSSAIKFEEITLIFQSMRPRILAVKTVVINALASGSNTNQIFRKNRYNIRQNTSATPTPKTARSDLMKDIMSLAIIEAPPKNNVPDAA